MSEIVKSQSFFLRVKRFFEPLLYTPMVTFKAIVVYSLWGITPIIHIAFIQRIVAEFELGDKQGFTEVIILYIIFNILYEISDFGMRKWGWVETVNSYRKHIDSKYIAKFIGADNNEVEKQGTGKLVSIITNGSDTWALSLDLFLLEIARIIFIFLFSCYMFFQVHPFYGLLFIIFYITIIFLGAIFNEKSLEMRRQRVKLWNFYIKTFVRILMSKVEIMQSGKIQNEIQNVNAISDDIIVVNRKMATWVYACYRIAEASVIWVKIAILFYVGLGIFDEKFSLAFFVALFAVMALMESTVTQTMKFFRNFTKEFTKIEQFWNFFDDTPQIQGYEDGETFIHKKGDIVLENVSYSYDDKKQIFKNFGVDIAGEKITAFVGPSGGGKSTLVKLISGYIRPDSGEISVDSQKLSQISLKSYYKDIGYLTQEPSVFDGTIRENLLYAVGDAIDDSQIAKVIELAHCEFIYDLVSGLDTEIGERGIKLSGGQKQRLAIAKIFLKNPKIIILDEPTSALDSISEKKITEAMHNLFKNRTVLVIAHRLQTVKHADDILVIENGEIRERGSHSSLIRKKGFYKQMLDLQSGF